MTAGQYLDVAGMAQDILDGVISHFAASAVCLPDRKVIAPGETRQIAWDCSSVIVTSGGIVWGQGPSAGSGIGRRSGNPVLSAGTRYATFAVQIIRCVPEHDGTEPPPDCDLTTAGLAVMVDAGLLSQALVELCGRGALKRMGLATAGDVAILGPAGGFAACEGTVISTATHLI